MHWHAPDFVLNSWFIAQIEIQLFPDLVKPELQIH